jgi:hypothetical protein
MPDDDRKKLLAELATADVEHAAADYRSRAATALTVEDRESHSRVADGFERIVERRRQAYRATSNGRDSRIRGSGEASMIGNWSGGGDPLLSTTLSNQTGRRYHMTVERLAPNTWEWLAWREADAMGQVVQRGVTSSSDTAMVAAEDAVVTLEIAAAAGPA